MKNKIAGVISLGGVLILLISYYLTYFAYESVSVRFMFQVVEPIFIGSMFFIVPTIIMVFLEWQVMKKWLVFFAGWFVTLSVILISMTPAFSHDFFPNLIDKESLTWILGIIYLIISLAIIVYQAVKGRKAK